MMRQPEQFIHVQHAMPVMADASLLLDIGAISLIILSGLAVISLFKKNRNTQMQLDNIDRDPNRQATWRFLRGRAQEDQQSYLNRTDETIPPDL